MSDHEHKIVEKTMDEMIKEVLEETSEVDLAEQNAKIDCQKSSNETPSVDVAYFISYNIQNEPIEEILKLWGLTELCELFHERKIDSYCLEHISDSDINILIPERLLDLRIKFKARLSQWRSLKSLPVISISKCLDSSSTLAASMDLEELVPTANTLVRSDSEKSSNHQLQNMNVLEILQSNSRGKLLLSKSSPFDASERKTLINLIVDSAIFNDIKLGLKEINALADQVIKMFPFEIKTCYYVASGNGGRARGPLYAAYNNKIKYLRKKGVISRSSKCRRVSGNSSAESPLLPSCSSVVDNTKSAYQQPADNITPILHEESQ